MPKLIGSSQTVVEHEGLTIAELAGNVATSDDTISIAYVTVSEPTAEPWLTLDYDEWICVKKGFMQLHYMDGENDAILEAREGDTVFIGKGERFRPVFPNGETEYIPVCLPAFRPDRCHREEGEEESEVTKNLLKLHSKKDNIKNNETNVENDVLYHMCQKASWDKAVQSKKAYFPSSFEADGGFTHATAVPERLITTANHFYTKTEGDWICLQLSRSALLNVGIITKDEGALPVGEQKVEKDWVDSEWICPHIYGGLPTLECLGVLTGVYDMVRDENGQFLRILNLTE